MCSCLSYVLSCWTAGATADTLLGIVKDNAESMTHSATNAAYAMPKVYSILTPTSLNWTVAGLAKTQVVGAFKRARFWHRKNCAE